MATEGAMDRLIRNGLRLSLMLLVVVLCFVGWRVAALLQRVETEIASISYDVRQVTGAAADVSAKIGELTEKVDRLSRRTQDTMQLDDAAHLMEELDSLRRPRHDPTPRSQAADAEIEHLLDAIRAFDGRFLQYEDGELDDELSPWSLTARLKVKQSVYGSRLGTAEEFIGVAATSMTGDRYWAAPTDSERIPLDRWLQGVLAAYRAAPAGESAAVSGD